MEEAERTPAESLFFLLFQKKLIASRMTRAQSLMIHYRERGIPRGDYLVFAALVYAMQTKQVVSTLEKLEAHRRLYEIHRGMDCEKDACPRCGQQRTIDMFTVLRIHLRSLLPLRQRLVSA
jgi:hypothetical protein